MHSFTSHGFTFAFNSDLSGNVIIMTAEGARLDVPGQALLDFVAEHVRRQKIARIEQATTDELLGTDEG